MSLTLEEMKSIKTSVLGGVEAAARWNEALNALHAYAKASGCPLGLDVLRWFETQRDTYQVAMSAAIAQSAETEKQARG